MEYYYLVGDLQKGPVTQSKLLAEIDADTMVWREGIEWMRAVEVPELASSFSEPEKQPSFTAAQTYNATIVPPKMFSAAFSFDGRIRRTEYGWSVILYAIAYYIALDKITYNVAWYFLLPMLWFLWAQGAKRCHDRGNSGWYQLIPFYVLWMLFAEGESGANEYGNSPK